MNIINEGLSDVLQVYALGYAHGLLTQEEFLERVQGTRDEIIAILEKARRRDRRPLAEILIQGRSKLKGNLETLESMGLANADVELRKYDAILKKYGHDTSLQ